MSRGTNLPQTFERRGTCVPFVSIPALFHVRVREYLIGRDRVLEATLPNFSGTRRGEFTVVNWKDIPSFGTLSERDAFVHQSVAGTTSSRQLDPINIRAILQRADSIYNPDEAKRRQAREQTQRDLEEREIVRMSCLAQMTRECGIARGDTFMAHASTQTMVELMTGKTGMGKFKVEDLIQKVMAHTAERSGKTIEEIRDWLEPLVGMIAPFGSVASKGEQRTDGYLFRQHLRLLELRKSLNEYGAISRPEIADSIQLILQVVDQTIAYISERIVSLDDILASLSTMFKGYDKAMGRLEKLRRDVAYGLDGWDDLITIWLDAIEGQHLHGGEQGLERAIGHILWYLPIIPYKELHGDSFSNQSDFERARVRIVGQMHSWQTDELDYELKARVEKGKSVADAEKAERARWRTS